VAAVRVAVDFVLAPDEGGDGILGFVLVLVVVVMIA